MLARELGVRAASDVLRSSFDWEYRDARSGVEAVLEGRRSDREKLDLAGWVEVVVVDMPAKITGYSLGSSRLTCGYRSWQRPVVLRLGTREYYFVLRLWLRLRLLSVRRVKRGTPLVEFLDPL